MIIRHLERVLLKRLTWQVERLVQADHLVVVVLQADLATDHPAVGLLAVALVVDHPAVGHLAVALVVDHPAVVSSKKSWLVALSFVYERIFLLL